MNEILKKLVFATAVSGREDEVRKVIEKEIAPYVDEIKTDALGNLTAHKKGNGKRVVFCAHMDNAGFFVTFVGSDGGIRVSPVGNVNLLSCAYSDVVSENGVKGILVSEKSDEVPKGENVYIDIGAKDAKTAEKKVNVGDFFVPAPKFTKLLGTRLTASSFDGKAGCAALIETVKELKNTENDLYFVFTTQQEVYSRGARTVAYAIKPDVIISVDTTTAKDKTSPSKSNISVGGGVGIKIKSQGFIASPKLVEVMRKLADESKIKYQNEVLSAGGESDASSMQIGADGALATAISIPCANLHTGVEIIDTDDYKNAVKLLIKAAEEI